jgi:hypothetical protein
VSVKGHCMMFGFGVQLIAEEITVHMPPHRTSFVHYVRLVANLGSVNTDEEKWY